MSEPSVSAAKTAAPQADYYVILGVQSSADQASIRQRYRALALENHPDRFVTVDQKAAASVRFKAIREAYEVLADLDQRRRYDASVAQGKSFVPAKDAGSGAEPTLADIFSDVDRFPFPSQAAHVSDIRLREMINESIINSDGLKEKVIAVHGVTSSDVCESTLPDVRGVQASAKNVILTNFRVIVALEGRSEYQSENTRFSQSYWAGITVTLLDLNRIDLTVTDGASSGFGLILYGPETPLCGVKFSVHGSPAPFLWLCSLYSIPITVVLQTRTGHEAYRKAAWQTLVLGAAAACTLAWILGNRAGGGVQTALLVAPLALFACAGYFENMKSCALAKVYALLGAA